MADSKKYNGSTWLHSLRKLTTSTDTLTTLPADLYADGNNATVGISGNMSQTGTPTPDNPIMPEGTGERTGNLANLYGVDKTFLGLHYTVGENMSIVINGTKEAGVNVHSLVYPNITLPAGTYTTKVKMVSGNITDLTTDDGLFFGINQSTYGQRTAPGVKQVGDVGKRTFTLDNDTLLSSIDIAPSYGSEGSVWTNATFECWLYVGSDDKPYSPYGIKIPISSANTTTPVYLGEVETRRKIKKLVFDGSEPWMLSGNIVYINNTNTMKLSPLICTHFPNVANTGMWNGNNWIFQVDISNLGMSGRDAWIAYLQQKYANGTPVTVWYVLATEETGIVNEPIRKIGNYADAVSGISIPTISGADSFDVLTTLKPSEVSLAYTGWHDASVEEWDGSQWQ